jgi:hypothetical protein
MLDLLLEPGEGLSLQSLPPMRTLRRLMISYTSEEEAKIYKEVMKLTLFLSFYIFNKMLFFTHEGHVRAAFSIALF